MDDTVETIMIKTKHICILLLATLLTSLFIPLTRKKELRWGWNTIDTQAISFPPQFQFCVATAEYQITGTTCSYKGQKRKTALIQTGHDMSMKKAIRILHLKSI